MITQPVVSTWRWFSGSDPEELEDSNDNSHVGPVVATSLVRVSVAFEGY